jgi:hypothetical protein
MHGTSARPIIIAAVGDGPVILDGTVAIDGPWVAQAGGYSAVASPSGQDILQLFINGEMQVLARYPNARWSDKSVFYGVKNWFRSVVPGIHNLSTGEGLLHDAGKCADPADCCSHCNSHDLAKSGVNATGALAILNMWSCDTGVQRIVTHAATEPNMLRYNATWEGLCDDFRGGDGRYFLEGLPSLLDSPEEWLFDNSSKSVLRPTTAPLPAGAEVRGRVSDFALVVTNASFVQFANLSFFATTLSATGDVGNLSFTSLEFNYSAVSRRSLGDIEPPSAFTVWRSREADAKREPRPAKFVFEDVIVRYSDGMALYVNGDGTVIRDCLFEWNDWTAVGGSWPIGVARHGKAQRAATVRTSGEDLVVERVSFRNNGAAQSLTAGGGSRVQMCNFASQLAIQDDGAFVEGGGTPSTVYIRNWCTNSGKAGLRWDGYYPSTLGGLMLENVAWNTSAMMVKGDQHNVTANTVFDPSDIRSGHAAHDRPRYQDHNSRLDNISLGAGHASVNVGAGTKKYDPRADKLTVFSRNIFDGAEIAGKQCPAAPNCSVPGRWYDNLIGTLGYGNVDGEGNNVVPFDIRAELRDPYHHDFRPCPRSTVAKLSAGAYPVYSAKHTAYWIPGRRERSDASTPVPPTGSIGVHRNTELMFLPASRATGHSVYLASGGADDGDGNTVKKQWQWQHLVDLVGAANIARPSVVLPSALDPNMGYAWRVDTHTPTGVVQGQAWTLRTGMNMSCEITPDPPAPPPMGCAAAEDKQCPGEAGKGAKVGDPCYNCVVSHSSELGAAGCWGPHGRHNFIEAFCGSSSN